VKSEYLISVPLSAEVKIPNHISPLKSATAGLSIFMVKLHYCKGSIVIGYSSFAGRFFAGAALNG
jgi:hypothetical protein